MAVSRFMALCLYHPEHGYYEAKDRAIGREGDFYTSVSVGPVFGEMLAWLFAHWFRTELQPPFQILECGAHHGQLASDIIDFFEANSPALCDNLEYVIFEPSSVRRARQEEKLGARRVRVRWINRWRELGKGIQGVIFANELLDAFPVDQLGWDSVREWWFEWRITSSDAGFVKIRGGQSPAPPVPIAPGSLYENLPDGFTIEIHQSRMRWWKDAADHLRQGRLLTLDYGYEFPDMFQPFRHEGTLRAYRAHQAGSDILENVGEQDLTSNVEFRLLKETGEECGLKSSRLLTQAQFLTNILAGIEAAPGSFPEWTPKRLREFQTLVHPAHLGEKFKVLIQRREK